MKRMGRPPLPKRERRDELIMVRVNREEHSQLANAAKRNDLTVSDYVRQAALKEAKE